MGAFLCDVMSQIELITIGTFESAQNAVVKFLLSKESAFKTRSPFFLVLFKFVPFTGVFFIFN